jgi:hypothetical protein
LQVWQLGFSSFNADWVCLRAYTTIVEGSRVYLRLHYPTDIIGSFCLAAMAVSLAQMQSTARLGAWFIRWENAFPSTFYMSAFFASYQIATAFQDLRDLVALFGR